MQAIKSETQKSVVTKCAVKECQNPVDKNTGIPLQSDGFLICRSCNRLRKSCSVCDGILPRTEFPPDPKMQNGIRNQCKQCRAHLKRGYSAELIRKNFPRMTEDGHKQTHCLDLCNTELAMGQPIAGDDCNCQLCTDARAGKVMS